MNNPTGLAPIRKIIVGAATGAVILAARKALGIELGSETVSDVLNLAIAYGASYAIKDPRVQAVAAEVEVFVSEHPAMVADLHDLADRFVATHEDTKAVIDAAFAAASRAEASKSAAVAKVQTAA